MKNTNTELLKRIAALEKRVEELERRPVYVPYYVPPAQLPEVVPAQPWQPWQPYIGPTCPVTQPTWVCVGGGMPPGATMQ